MDEEKVQRARPACHTDALRNQHKNSPTFTDRWLPFAKCDRQDDTLLSPCTDSHSRALLAQSHGMRLRVFTNRGLLFIYFYRFLCERFFFLFFFPSFLFSSFFHPDTPPTPLLLPHLAPSFFGAEINRSLFERTFCLELRTCRRHFFIFFFHSSHRSERKEGESNGLSETGRGGGGGEF